MCTMHIVSKYDCDNTGKYDAKQKQFGCKKMRGQSEAACKQAGATKSFEAKKLLYQKYF